MLTKKQKEFFDELRSYVRRKGYFPSFREFKDYIGLSSTNSVWKYMKKLESKDYIEKIGNQYSLVENPEFIDIPLMGIVPAGDPVEIFNELGEQIQLPEWFIGDNDLNVFALKVEGLSMKDAYINEGDIVIIRKTDNVFDGDMIIALLPDNSITLKKLRIKSKYIILVPENPDYPPLKIDNVKILGKVIGVLRKYE